MTADSRQDRDDWRAPGFQQVGAERPRAAVSVVLCSTIALSYTASAMASTHTQRSCGYNQPFMITYLNEAFLGLLSTLALMSTRPPCAAIRSAFRKQFAWAFVFAPLALSANVAFTAALRLTSTASAVTLEQLTSLFIAFLSCCILKVRYRCVSLPLLLVAVAGAIVATLADSAPGSTVDGTNPVLGDILALAVALLASLYMVIFKYAFPSMEPTAFIVFLTVKAVVTICLGWVVLLIFDALRWERFRIPKGCAALWVPFGAVVSSVFNCSLIWTTMKLSPLTARLSLLFAIPCSFVIDLIMHGTFNPLTLSGVLLIFFGVLGFEMLSTRKEAVQQADMDTGL